MKSKKYLTLIAASLLAVAPVTSVVVASQPTTEVHAATVLTSDQLMAPYYSQDNEKVSENTTIIHISKKSPRLNAYNNEKVETLTKRRITDLSSNHGHIGEVGDIDVYPVFDNGRPDWKHVLDRNAKLKAGKQYVAAIQATVTGLHEKQNYESWQAYSDNDHEIAWAGQWSNNDGSIGAVLLVPVSVSNKQAPVRYNKVITKYANRVKTYKSNGSFSHHYAYKNHTYKVSGKKYIKGRGMCYKISGKNQYIPVKYLQHK